MSAVGEAFLQTIGRPEPEADPGLQLPDDAHLVFWERIHREIGAGWYMDRFLYLFGTGLDALKPCLDAWPFLVSANEDRVILGRNAYGAILVLENASGRATPARVHMLDPVGVAYWTDPALDFGGLIGYWLPKKTIPRFLDNGVYEAWVRAEGRHLEPDEVLAIKVPLGLGGTMELSNFQPENIVEYYRTAAPIYERAFAQMRGRSP